jgi:hypothetical protein
MHLYDKKHSANRGLIAAAAVFLAIVLLFVFAFASVSSRSAAEETVVLERALRRAIVTCYAVEGKYPPNLDYLYDNYGITVDENRFAVFYDVFASNVMPSFSVQTIGGAG